MKKKQFDIEKHPKFNSKINNQIWYKKQNIQMKQITVLGGSGFIGSALADLLSKKGKIKVIIFDRKKKNVQLSRGKRIIYFRKAHKNRK